MPKISHKSLNHGTCEEVVSIVHFVALVKSLFGIRVYNKVLHVKSLCLHFPEQKKWRSVPALNGFCSHGDRMSPVEAWEAHTGRGLEQSGTLSKTEYMEALLFSCSV